MKIKIFENKKSLSGVVETVMLILLTLVALGVIAAFIFPFVKNSLSNAGNCNIDSATKVHLNAAYTCYYTGNINGTYVSIELGEVKVDKILISLKGGGNVKSYLMQNNTSLNGVSMYKTGSGILLLPGENEGKTYFISNFGGKAEQVGVAPVIGGKQCDIADQIFVDVCQNNIAAPPANSGSSTCVDSDVTSQYPDGKNPLIFGTVTVSGLPPVINSDSCVNSNTVNEWYCDPSGPPGVVQISCPSGYSCSNGACISAGATCSDSDINSQYLDGKNPLIQGTTITTGLPPFLDTCFDSNTVNEGFCGGAAMGITQISCPSGKSCVNGACG